MFKTCKQTYEMYFPNSTNKFIGYEEAPPLPIEPGQKFCKLTKRLFNAWIYWTQDKTQINYDDGRVLIYWRKPSLQYAISRQTNGDYFRFHSDGSVEHGMGGEYYHWGPDIYVEYDPRGVREECPECWVNLFYDNNPHLIDDDVYDSEYDYYDYRDEVGRWYYD